MASTLTTTATQRRRQQWEDVIAAWFDAYPESAQEWDDGLYMRALERLINRDVTDTRYGIRVALRRDLGDDRAAAEAYWLTTADGEKKRCRCWAYNSDDRCSHALAARLFAFSRR